MATRHGSQLSGKLDGKIHYIVNGKEYVRSMPAHVGNPRSEAQQTHRSAFVGIVRLSSRMSEAHRIGLHRYAQRKKSFPYLCFRKLNKACFTPDGRIDYPRIVLSHGPVAGVGFTSVRAEADGSLLLAYDPCLAYSHSAPDDRLYLYAYSPARESGVLFDPVPRAMGDPEARGIRTLTLRLPEGWLAASPGGGVAGGDAAGGGGLEGDGLEVGGLGATHECREDGSRCHLYAFLRDRRGFTSATIHIPLPTV